MKRILNINDTVYTPCTNFNEGCTWLQEKVVKEISNDHIVLEHIADLRKNGAELDRIEVLPKTFRGDKKDVEYYSRSFAEIMKVYQEENDWFVQQILKEAEGDN